MNSLRHTKILLAAACISLVNGTTNGALGHISQPRHQNNLRAMHAAIVEMGPIDLRRKYLSMTGPEIGAIFSIRKLLDSHLIVLPESKVRYAGVINSTFPSFYQPTAERLQKRVRAVHALQLNTSATGRLATDDKQVAPRLYWFKGMKVELFNETNQRIKTAQFLCHLNLDVDLRAHKAFFPSSIACSARVASLDAGTPKIMLPEGSGVPFADSERLRVWVQAINLNGRIHKRIKIRFFLYFVPSRKSEVPVRALDWETVSLRVIAKDHLPSDNRSNCSSTCCSEQTSAYDAPNDPYHQEYTKSGTKQLLSGHWLVPPGIHVYSSPVNLKVNRHFTDHGPLVLASFHVHPFCKTISLVEYSGDSHKVIFSMRSKTLTVPAPHVVHTDVLVFSKGIAINKAGKYRIESVYNNTASRPLDAMVNGWLFFEIPHFKKPAWVTCSTH